MKNWLKRGLACLLALGLMLPMGTAFAAGTTQIPSDAFSYNGHYYYAYSSVMNWTEAKSACERVGGHLATITTQGEQDAIMDYLQTKSGRSGYWLGGTDRNKEGVWTWVTGEAWSYTHWDKVQPDNTVSPGNYAPDGQKDEDYLGIAMGARNWAGNGFWNDFSNNHNGSDTGLGYLCEWDYASDWAGKEIQQAVDAGLIPDVLKGQNLKNKITRAEFAAVAVTLYETMSGREAPVPSYCPFWDIGSSSCRTEIQQAYALGIVNGVTDTKFSPDAQITREQLAAMLCRAYKKMAWPSWTLATDASYPLDYSGVSYFADHKDISDYAVPSVYFMVKHHVINGVGDNLFAPKNTTTAQAAVGYANASREQAILMSLRCYQNLD